MMDSKSAKVIVTRMGRDARYAARRAAFASKARPAHFSGFARGIDSGRFAAGNGYNVASLFLTSGADLKTFLNPGGRIIVVLVSARTG